MCQDGSGTGGSNMDKLPLSLLQADKQDIRVQGNGFQARINGNGPANVGSRSKHWNKYLLKKYLHVI